MIRLSRSTRRKFDGEKGRAPVASRAVIVGLCENCKSLRYVRMIVSPSIFLLPAEIFLHPLKRGSCRRRHRKKGGGQQAATWMNGKEEGCDDDVAGRRGKPRGGGGNSIRLQIELYAACWRDNDIYARQAYDVWSAHMLCEGGRMKQRRERERGAVKTKRVTCCLFPSSPVRGIRHTVNAMWLEELKISFGPKFQSK